MLCLEQIFFNNPIILIIKIIKKYEYKRITKFNCKKITI